MSMFGYVFPVGLFKNFSPTYFVKGPLLTPLHFFGFFIRNQYILPLIVSIISCPCLAGLIQVFVLGCRRSLTFRTRSWQHHLFRHGNDVKCQLCTAYILQHQRNREFLL
jgi:hypothetical protein